MRKHSTTCLAATLSITLLGGLPLAVNAQAARGAPVGLLADGDEVTDTATGLIWRRCAEGQKWNGTTCRRDALSVNWREALLLAQTAASNGVPWRLPNIKELSSLVDHSRTNPAIDVTAFPATPAILFWSSSHSGRGQEGSKAALYVNFLTGEVGSTVQSGGFAVRLVRDGP